MIYTQEQLNAMTPDQLKATILQQQTEAVVSAPSTIEKIKTTLIDFNKNLLVNHGVSVPVATVISAAAVSGLFNMVYVLIPLITK